MKRAVEAIPVDGGRWSVSSGPMLTSVKWLNRYLSPADLTADEAEDVLTRVGFPIESREEAPGGDVRLDVELTSNRGDCLCHLGLAREIAAATGRRLAPPTVKSEPGEPRVRVSGEGGGAVENRIGEPGCPRFTARIIRGVKVGPSPAWLREALESVGQRSINSVVDVSNFVLLEMGYPSHAFDLEKVAERRLIVRFAHAGERLKALDARTHTLAPEDMVVADAKGALSLAGVIGGIESGVTPATRAVLLEVATWDPATVRRTARRLDIRTDASHRFERFVDAPGLEQASRRCAELILEVAGGAIEPGFIDERPRPGGDARAIIKMRTSRCDQILGVHVPTAEVARLLTSLGIEAAIERHGGEEIARCRVPPNRHDLTREIDLIEEVGRLHGFDKIEIGSSLELPLDLRHPREWPRRERAMAEMGRVLTGMGFFETVTFSFVAEEEARAFCPTGLRLLKVDEERRKGAPWLRPSVIPSLLTCRRANQDGQVRREGGVRLFESASVFAEMDDADKFARATIENQNLALLVDAPGKAEGAQAGIRLVRGAVEGVAQTLGGAGARIELRPCEPFMPALEGETVASVLVNGAHAGYLTTLIGAARRQWDLDEPVVAAEINLALLIALSPPVARSYSLPKFPPIERDLSLVVAEGTPWGTIEECARGAKPQWLEEARFVGVFRGKQIGTGKKSVTMRLVFRDAERTLRHEEVDEQVGVVVARLATEIGGELRGPAAAGRP